jgi:hypothetical protein
MVHQLKYTISTNKLNNILLWFEFEQVYDINSVLSAVKKGIFHETSDISFIQMLGIKKCNFS